MTIRDRLQKFISHLGITNATFEKSSGLGNGFVNKSGTTIRESKLEQISNTYPELNMEWLLHGIGSMIKGGVEEFKPRTIPLIHIDSVGGANSENLIVSPEYIERYVPFADAKSDDICIYQSGESMSPTIPAGAILHLREVTNWREYFGFGGYFVLLLADGRRITKQVLKGEQDPYNNILVHSINPLYSDEEVPRSFITRVFKIINVLVNNGW